MKDRIRAIMEYENLTPSAFADKLQIGRAVISHILNGRNNPSLDVVTRILSSMDYISPDWLLAGTGEMLKQESKNVEVNSPNTQQEKVSTIFQPDLFAQNQTDTYTVKEETKYLKEKVVEEPPKAIENTVKETIIYQKAPERKISKIIIYYTDNTFETFNTDNNPL